MVWIYWEDDVPIAETADPVSEPEPETVPDDVGQESEPETSDPVPAPSVPELESEPETSEPVLEEDSSSSSRQEESVPDDGSPILDNGDISSSSSTPSSSSSEPETPPDEETSTPTTGAESRPFLSTPVEEYSVTEGLLLCVLAVVLALGLLSVVRRH